MDGASLTLLQCLALLSLLPLGNCLQCYTCLSTHDTHCEKLSQHQLVDCDWSEIMFNRSGIPPPKQYCLKVVFKVSEKLVTARGCAQRDDICENQKPEIAEMNLTSPVSCELCLTDGCNAAAVTNPSVTLPLVIVLSTVHRVSAYFDEPT